MPLLLLGTGATPEGVGSSGAGGGRTAATAARRAQAKVVSNLPLDFEVPRPTTPVTTIPAPVTTTPAPVTTTPDPVTTTAAAPPPTTIPSDRALGIATWYAQAPPGRCASPWLAEGTVLSVVDLTTGVSITCLVDDREANDPGRVVDLSPSGFEEMAPLSQGVIQVAVSW
ncbi:MAG: septal ring lytic transglycosylase RlpA family protein [Acidimicrobiales bacterium]